MTANPISLDHDELRAWMVNYITTVLEVPIEPFPTAATFDIYGFDSAEAVIMAGVMEEEFRVQIGRDFVFQDNLLNPASGLDLDAVDVPAVEVNSRYGSFEDLDRGLGQVVPPAGALPQPTPPLPAFGS